jgi:hypothetical protein
MTMPVIAQTAAEPTYAELRARNLLAQSLISHRLDTTSEDVSAVLAALRGDLTLAGDE